jgi:hypothetical protein
MTLNNRLKAIEQKAAPAESGIVIVGKYETVEDAIKRSGISEERQRMGIVLIPAKNPRSE